MSKHTPGPWRVGGDGNIYAGDDPVIHSVGDSEGSYLAATQDDRRLIAAAPDLLTACDASLGYLVMFGTDHGDGIRAVLRAAMAKARGEKS